MKDFILLIPYYNDPEGLVLSLKSIDYPTDNFEIIIVDDGSQEPIPIEELEHLSPRLPFSIIKLQYNVGVAKALNAVLCELKKRNDYKYIARLDCGDKCTDDRFVLQVKFLEANPNIALLGTYCSFVLKSSNKSYLYKSKLKHNDIVKEMHFRCSFIHPTVMFRPEVLELGLYPENYPYAEDYAFFWIIVKQFKTEILPQNCLSICVNSSNISSKNYRQQLISRKRIVAAYGVYPVRKFIGILLIILRFIAPAALIETLKYTKSQE